MRVENSAGGVVLIVDDNPANLEMLGHFLNLSGFEVLVAIDGESAIEQAVYAQPDLILLDILMPEVDGFETCRRLKADQSTQDIPVIFMTALNGTADKVKGFDVGAVDYVTKPIQLEEVLARIASHLSIQNLQKKIRKQNLLLQQEVKERQRAEEQIRLLQAITQAIGESQDFYSALKVTLCQVCKAIGWNYGQAWIPNSDGTLLESSSTWYTSTTEDGTLIPALEKLERFHRFSEVLRFAPGIGLPGRVWSSKQPEWIQDIFDQDAMSVNSQMVLESGLKSCLGIPIVVGERVLAVLVFFTVEPREQDRRLVKLVSVVTTQLGSVIQRKQAEEALRLAEQRYHSIVENAIEGIFQTTASGRFMSANPALARIFRYSSPEELITSIKDISRQLYVDPHRRDEFIAAIQTDSAVFEFESLVYRKDRTVIWISENTRAVRDSTGSLLYYEGTVSDVTARKVAREALRYQQSQSDELLLNILPAPIAQRLKMEQGTIADSFAESTVMFADIVNFTEFSARTSAKELVQFLNLIFSRFDQLAEQHGLEKIKTIGDAYMVVAGLPTPRPDHAMVIAEMALDMQAEMVKIGAETGEAFKLRIGINSGPVVAGVIGIKKFIYDLWGDTVNIASRMESQGVDGAIQVTAVTYDLIKDKYLLEKRGVLSVRGRGDMTTYLLVGKQSGVLSPNC